MSSALSSLSTLASSLLLPPPPSSSPTQVKGKRKRSSDSNEGRSEAQTTRNMHNGTMEFITVDPSIHSIVTKDQPLRTIRIFRSSDESTIATSDTDQWWVSILDLSLLCLDHTKTGKAAGTKCFQRGITRGDIRLFRDRTKPRKTSGVVVPVPVKCVRLTALYQRWNIKSQTRYRRIPPLIAWLKQLKSLSPTITTNRVEHENKNGNSTPQPEVKATTNQPTTLTILTSTSTDVRVVKGRYYHVSNTPTTFPLEMDHVHLLFPIPGKPRTFHVRSAPATHSVFGPSTTPPSLSSVLSTLLPIRTVVTSSSTPNPTTTTFQSSVSISPSTAT